MASTEKDLKLIAQGNPNIKIHKGENLYVAILP